MYLVCSGLIIVAVPVSFFRMYKIVFLGFMIVLIVAACQISPTDRQAGDQDTTGSETRAMEPGQAVIPEGNPEEGVDRNSVLMEESSSRQFDGKQGEEQFHIALLGEEALSGTVAFTITNGEGELIYSDEFPAMMLAATYDESINTPEKQEALIRERIEEFFLDERFKAQPIEGDQPPHDSFFKSAGRRVGKECVSTG